MKMVQKEKYRSNISFRLQMKEINMLPYIAGLYVITNAQTKKQYIGKSVNIKTRFILHLRNLEKQKHVNQLLQSDFDLYGSNVFSVVIQFKIPIDMVRTREGWLYLNLLEQEEILLADKDKLYNLNFNPNKTLENIREEIQGLFMPEIKIIQEIPESSCSSQLQEIDRKASTSYQLPIPEEIVNLMHWKKDVQLEFKLNKQTNRIELEEISP